MLKNVPANNDLLTWPIALLRIVRPKEAEELSSLSWDTIEREHADKIVRLSPHCVGMRVGHALMLAK